MKNSDLQDTRGRPPQREKIFVPSKIIRRPALQRLDELRLEIPEGSDHRLSWVDVQSCSDCGCRSIRGA